MSNDDDPNTPRFNGLGFLNTLQQWQNTQPLDVATYDDDYEDEDYEDETEEAEVFVAVEKDGAFEGVTPDNMYSNYAYMNAKHNELTAKLQEWYEMSRELTYQCDGSEESLKQYHVILSSMLTGVLDTIHPDRTVIRDVVRHAMLRCRDYLYGVVDEYLDDERTLASALDDNHSFVLNSIQILVEMVLQITAVESQNHRPLKRYSELSGAFQILFKPTNLYNSVMDAVAMMVLALTCVEEAAYEGTADPEEIRDSVALLKNAMSISFNIAARPLELSTETAVKVADIEEEDYE
jgi:hypothetical protein